MRLNWFLPFLRKRKKNETLRPLGIFSRAARRILPQRFFADRETGKPGWIRKALKWIGPSMLSSPFRRVVQGSCFVLFLVLFFYVCWPYTARPLPPPKISEGWQLGEIDQETGSFSFETSSTPGWVRTSSKLHVIDAGAAEYEDGYVGQFSLSDSSSDQVTLLAAPNVDAEQLDRLFVSAGPWSLSERAPDEWPTHYADDLAAKEFVPADVFLVIDPLVSFSTAITARSWVWSLACAGAILLACVFIPRGFCGYLCPLGTLIDLFDWAFGKRVTRFRAPDDGWWVHIKYYVLLGTLVMAVCGVLVSGFVAAIPVITRGLLMLLEPLQLYLMKDGHQIPPIGFGHIFSIVLFLSVLALGFLQPRFWCKYACPTGAVFSLGNLFRVSERKVESTCINCNKCVEICPFDAIKPDFTTRVTDCTLCQTCGGVCPTEAIKFTDRWELVDLKIENDPPTNETPIGRRGFLSLATGTTAAIAGGIGLATGTRVFGGQPDELPVRPPGSVPEPQFLDMCIRCGECFKACPNNVLQVTGFEHGLESLWTPKVVADWAGCESSCNACGQVCPTGAIRALPMEEKRHARMGLAIINESTCLPFHGEACQLCVDECTAAGYDALEFVAVGTEVDEFGQPIEGTGELAPLLIPDRCVGCGLCQTRCHGINVVAKGLLQESAIIIEAGHGHEDRLMNGSYRQLREAEAAQKSTQDVPSENYLPDFMTNGEDDAE